MAIRALKLAAAAAFCALAAAGCATLPDTDAIIQRHTAQTVRFENARGALSAKKSAAILAELKRKSGDIDILEKQIALEQEIVGSPLIVGNKITLLQDGAATYAAMFAAIRKAQDHINLETYIIEDDDTGRQFADLLLEQQARGVQVTLIYDSVGGFKTPKAFFDRLRQGGINISGVYASGSVMRRTETATEEKIAWRDTDLQIEGPVVGELQKLFMQTWEKQRGKPPAPKAYFPALTPQGQDIVRAIGSTPDDPYSLMYLTLISAIGNAEKQVYLTNAYFVPDAQFLKSLTDAAARRVDVRLILPSHSDSAVVFHAGRSHYSALLKAGVKIYERLGALLHSKTAVIDGVWSTVGSTNLDWRSFLDNDEINAVIIGRDFAEQMQAMFAQDLASSEAIDPERWARRPLPLRFKEWMARVWGRLL